MATQDKVASALVQISLLRRGHSDDPANNVSPKWYVAMNVRGRTPWTSPSRDSQRCFFNTGSLVSAASLPDDGILVFVRILSHTAFCCPTNPSSRSYWLSFQDSTWGFRSRNRQHAISMADGEHTALPHSTHRHADGLQTLEARGHDSPVQHVRQGREESVLSYCAYGLTLL